jgi:hypothetical protein
MNDAGPRRPAREKIEQPPSLFVILNHESRKLTDADAAQCRQA